MNPRHLTQLVPGLSLPGLLGGYFLRQVRSRAMIPAAAPPR